MPFFLLVFFCHFWKFYEVLCFVVHLHWNNTNVHSLSLTRTISLILLFSLPFYWWQFETVWFLNNVYQMPICFKEMHIYKSNSLCFCWLTPFASFCYVFFCFCVRSFVHIRCTIILRSEKMEEGGGMQYINPLVKRNMAKLDKDGESCCIAMDSFKHYVGNLELASMPHLHVQVH